VAHEALFGWYGEDTPVKRIEGRVVTPEAMTLPCLSLIQVQDRIVPLTSAAALPNSTELRIALGHISMVVSENARERAWDAIVN
jgi:poly(3-hydroxyalkanoate) synthetase